MSPQTFTFGTIVGLPTLVSLTGYSILGRSLQGFEPLKFWLNQSRIREHMVQKKKEYLPIPVPERLNCEAFTPRPFSATSPKSHPSPYLERRTVSSQNFATDILNRKIGYLYLEKGKRKIAQCLL